MGKLYLHDQKVHYRYAFNITGEGFYMAGGSLCTAADSDSHMGIPLLHPEESG